MSDTITVYEKPTWSTCRKLVTAFREKGIDFERVNYFTDPLDEEKLKSILSKAGLRPYEVLRKRDKAFKENNVSENTSDEELFRLIVEHPTMLERPIVEYGNRAVLARPIDKALDLITWLCLTVTETGISRSRKTFLVAT